MRTRDDLIADWQQRLAATDRAEVHASKRSAWLARVRRRLYRFLLSLYGDGHWNAPPVEAPLSAAPKTAVFDSADAIRLAGKPAKSDGAIRGVLQAVAAARDEPNAPGPLAAGLCPESWVVVASASGRMRVNRVARFLRREGISALVTHRGDDRLVEIQAKDRDRAFAIMAARGQQLHGRDRQSPLAGVHFLVNFTVVTVFAPFLVGPLVLLLSTAATESPGGTIWGVPGGVLFFALWGACIVFYCCLAMAITVCRAAFGRHDRRAAA